MEPGVLYNIKNGSFSNKFDFQTCITTKNDLAQDLWKINYEAACLDINGYTELIVRQYLPYDKKNTPTIYNGMPLREEIRVFYNMDTKEIEYMVDYWDYEYCSSYLNKTDSIIFDYFHNKIGNRKTNHNKLLLQLETQIRKNINSLQFSDKLTGVWSIDFMYNEVDKNIYLIDMARGFRSAYWDINKLKSETLNKHKLKEDEN